MELIIFSTEAQSRFKKGSSLKKQTKTEQTKQKTPNKNHTYNQHNLVLSRKT